MASETLNIGDKAPDFKNLPGVDGKKYSLDDFKDRKVLVVVFSCNHCPYVQAYEDRMIAIQNDYANKGITLVAINSNEPIHYPEDNFDEMVKRAKKKGLWFPYLRDEDQTVANAYGATHTPEFFLFDQNRQLRYHGRLDDNWQAPSDVKKHYLRDALDAVLAGKEVPIPETYSIGCTIKWKA